MTNTGFINRIATAVPPHDVHRAFVDFAETMLPEGTTRNLFKRMARLAAIDHRYSFVEPVKTNGEGWQDAENIYVPGSFPSTARRMQVFEKFAPKLAGCALNKLAVTEEERRAVTHVIVTSCTGLYAPGLDFDIVRHLGLSPSVERTMIGFMGCYAAVNALKSANYIVRAQPDAKVLVLNLELCSLHFQETTELEQVLSFLLFADGCSASLVSAEPTGLAIDSFLAVGLPDSSDLITWRIGDGGFDMHLSGKVPGEIRRAMKDVGSVVTRGRDRQEIDLWAVHPGGRTILDAVEQGLELPSDALRFSRDILSRFGNMSSATVMFVLQKVMAEAQAGQQGCAMSFGPGVTAETMLFHAA
ncbi:type III polyketide synthase [Occallatibacter riparius]|uniref:Type III polyketide synthase n=1 Tax=Occallatibacter riparius TaxID=1002689 RepID=A0A9J7BN12_9BACT|nr:type III polyketide synthase [Occallatibacter riparius]UWZ84023.1 type III polyketide synthase [Occallatibacter riparius]